MSTEQSPPQAESAEQQQRGGAETYLRLLRYTGRYWLIFLIGTLGWLLHSAAEIAFVDLMGYITDVIAQNSSDAAPAAERSALPEGGFIASLGQSLFPEALSDHYWLVIPASLFVIALVRGIGYLIGSYGLAYVSNHLVHSLRVDLLTKFLYLPFRFFDASMGGHLVSTVTYNVAQVTAAGTKAVKTILQQGSMVIGFMAYLLYLNWKLTLIFLAVIPFIAWLVKFVSRRFRTLSHRIQASMGDLTHVTHEVVNGYEEVRMFGGSGSETERMHKTSIANTRQNMKMALAEGISNPTVMLLVSSAFGAIIAVMLHPSMLSEMTAGNFFSFLIASGMLIKPIRALTEVNSVVQRGIAAAESIFDVLDSEQELDEGSVEKSQVKGRFVFDDVSFRYCNSDRDVLNQISFSVEPGESIALVGSSGAGKTTLVSLNPRFYNHTGGTITLDGVPIDSYTLQNLRSHIALVSQRVTLFNDTIYNNIAYGELAGTPLEKVREAARFAYADEFIEGLENGYETLVGDDGVMLSGGQRQRIAIARALLKDAPILILDEATSALDTESERHIQAALEQLMKGRTTFVIAHRLSTIESADRILVVEEGTLVESGSHQQLLDAQGRYAQLHDTQFNGAKSALQANA
mgnify:FL=1